MAGQSAYSTAVYLRSPRSSTTPTSEAHDSPVLQEGESMQSLFIKLNEKLNKIRSECQATNSRVAKLEKSRQTKIPTGDHSFLSHISWSSSNSEIPRPISGSSTRSFLPPAGQGSIRSASSTRKDYPLHPLLLGCDPF